MIIILYSSRQLLITRWGVFNFRYPDVVGEPLLKANLSPKQWEKVLTLNTQLESEYNLRMEMLMKRLDVTIQSFLWCDKNKVRKSIYCFTSPCVDHFYLPRNNNFGEVLQSVEPRQPTNLFNTLHIT